MKQEEIIKLIVDKVMSVINKKVVLFFSGGAVNLKEIFRILSQYKYLNYQIVCTENCKKVIPKEYFEQLEGREITCKKELTLALKEADYIIVPIMTRNTLAKCSVGIQDNLATLGIAEALMLNKRVIAVEDSFSPYDEINVKLGFTRNEKYNSLILNNKNVLLSLGMEFIKASDLDGLMSKTINLDFLSLKEKEADFENDKVKANECDLINKCVEALKDVKADSELQDEGKKNFTEDSIVLKGIITVQDLIPLKSSKKKIIIDEKATLTPLAKDYFYNNKLY